MAEAPAPLEDASLMECLFSVGIVGRLTGCVCGGVQPFYGFPTATACSRTRDGRGSRTSGGRLADGVLM
ncbi:hypothetical protein RRG08_062813 [Elysia crispata]|uniref:Uncharacterized protein n=1 Tax=Elysia crispata TaxID=231223 RepID=A0AAE1D3I9_9GAST|nr:hypothetical protein RRG08_062813 [Elysia crispata]